LRCSAAQRPSDGQSPRARQGAKTHRIGLLASGAPASLSPNGSITAFKRRLTELGYELGRTLVIEERYHGGHIERLPQLAGELVVLGAELIVAGGPEAMLQAVLSKAGNSLPIVMAAIDYDPLAGGYIKQLNRPGGNITGVFLRQVEITAKRLELLKDALPTLKRVGVFWDSFTNEASEQMLAAKSTAERLGIETVAVTRRVDGMHLKDRLGNIETDCGDRFHARLPQNRDRPSGDHFNGTYAPVGEPSTASEALPPAVDRQAP
jgi:ABC-type uncharacterized transport system substrate-binding protein